jgi:hypothetical protein
MPEWLVNFWSYDWYTQLKIVGFWAFMVYASVFALRFGWRRGQARVKALGKADSSQRPD